MMEPVPWLFEKLSKSVERKHIDGDRVQLVNSALAQSGDPESKSGTKTFYRVDLEMLKEKKQIQSPMWDRMGSFLRSHIVKSLMAHAKMSHEEAEQFVQETEVNVQTAEDILGGYGLSAHSIDVFVVDTEGYDFIVIKEFLGRFPEFRPRLVIYESRHLSQDDKDLATQFMRNMGYFTIPTGMNELCIKI